MLEVVIELLGFHRLMYQQVLSDGAQLVGMPGKDALALGGGLIEDRLDLLIDDTGGLLGIALGLAEVAADEDGVAGAVKDMGPSLSLMP